MLSYSKVTTYMYVESQTLPVYTMSNPHPLHMDSMDHICVITTYSYVPESITTEPVLSQPVRY